MPFKDWNRPGEQPQGQSQNQEPRGNLKERDPQKQQGGMSREPNLQKNTKQIQPTHQVD